MPASFGFGLIDALRPDEDQREAVFLSVLEQVSRTLDPPLLREFYSGTTFVDGGDAEVVAEVRDGVISKRSVAAGEAPSLLPVDIPRGTLEELVGQIDVILPAAATESEIVVPEDLLDEDVNNPLQCISTAEARRRLNSHAHLDTHDRGCADILLEFCREADSHSVAVSLSWI